MASIAFSNMNFRKDLIAIVKANAEGAEADAFIAELEAAGIYGEPTEDEFDKFDEIV